MRFFGFGPIFHRYRNGHNGGGYGEAVPSPELAMKQLVCLSYLFITSSALPAALRLEVRPQGDQVLLNWTGGYPTASGEMVYPIYQVQQSPDLTRWEPVGPLVRGKEGLMRLLLERQDAAWFFRVSANLNPAAELPTADGGAEVFGYSAAFGAKLSEIGQISAAEFATRYGPGYTYLAGINFDPTNAMYWRRFGTDPAVNNVGLSPTNEGYRFFDFRLTPAEKARVRQNGFVVSARMGYENFAEPLYQLWNDDMPVFISTDALLQAWHQSYANMVIELETLVLNKYLGDMLSGMAAQIPAAQQEATPALQESLLDADYFLAVALSLQRGTNVASALGQEDRVQHTVALINAEGYGCVRIFDYPRNVDFSQFKPRGHYTDNETLQRYFKTVMWLGRMDLRVAGEDQDCDGFPLPPSVRQLGTAVVLTRLLQLADQFQTWQDFDKIIQSFVGITDSMTFLQLLDLMTAAGIQTLSDLADAADLRNFQARIEQGEIGVQHIRGDAFISPLGAQLRLPRSFTVFGQKFVIDAWAQSKVVYDDILWNTNKVVRRVNSALDVAFGVFNNRQIVPELVARMTNNAARSSTNHTLHFRDGYKYQHNLAAVRAVINGLDTNYWNANIYLSWLGCLRELSRPTIDSMYPQAMRTRAWALRTLNTQLASWAQLRHDTILYVKQPYTSSALCNYPDGFVEPRAEFWGRLEQMATNAANTVKGLPYQGTATIQKGFSSATYNLATIKSNQVNFLKHFATHIGKLREIAEQHLRHEPMSAAQLQFLNDMMQNVSSNNYYRIRTYTGWYPSLFYRHSVQAGQWNDGYSYALDYGATKYDALVADVHTDAPSPLHNDPGGILHQAVGKVHLMYIVIDDGAKLATFAGPVFSHYEFETAFPTRLTDGEWKQMLANGEEPPHPEWTRTWLVPAQ